MTKYQSFNNSSTKIIPKRNISKSKPSKKPAKKIIKFKPGNDLAGKVK
jgi:hypothetical protein